MMYVKLILLSGFLFLCLSISYSQWEQVSNGIGNQKVNALIINGSYMFAGTETNGVYVSADNGTTWSQTTLTGNRALCLAATDTRLFAGIYQSGVYFSDDKGATWTQTSLYSTRITGLAIIGSTVFASIAWDTSSSGVYVSNDNGITWSRTSVHNFTVSVIADSNTLYAGTQNLSGGDFLYRSYDLGATWAPILNKRIFSMYFGSGFILAGYGGNNGGGISRSTDNGVTWTTALNGVHTYAIAGSSNFVFAGSLSEGAYNSTDYGKSWNIRNEGMPVNALGIQDLEVYNNYVYAATLSGIWRNPNNYFTIFYDYGTYTGFSNWVTNQGWGFTWAVTNGAFTDSPGKNSSIKNYSNNADNSMTLKNGLNVSGYEKIKISFTHKYLTQAGKDFCRVEVSSNNGATWAEAKNYSGVVDTMIVDEVDITALANNSTNLKIRFRLTSDSRIVNDGWYVTNIRVIGKTATGNFNYRLTGNETPKKFLLEQNYPNPFNPSTRINYKIPVQSFVTLKIYNILGKEIAVLINKEQNEGNYQVEFDANNLPSGVYFYKLVCRTFSDTKRMVLVK